MDVVGNQLLVLPESDRDDVLQEVYKLLCMSSVGEVEVHALH